MIIIFALYFSFFGKLLAHLSVDFSSFISSQPFCTTMGSSSTVLPGQTVPICLQLYGSGNAIRVPADTATVKYGSLITYQSLNQLSDRKGNQWNIKANTPLPAVTSTRDYSQLLVKVTFSKKVGIKVQAVVWVPQTTMIKPFIGNHALVVLTHFFSMIFE